MGTAKLLDTTMVHLPHWLRRIWHQLRHVGPAKGRRRWIAGLERWYDRILAS